VGPNSTDVGGLAGNSYCPIVYSYSIGNVKVGSGTNYVGGLIGHILGGVVQASYWDKQTSGQKKSASGIGLTTWAMQHKQNYSTWNFTKIWYPPSVGVYPRLRQLALPLSWEVADVTYKFGTMPMPGAAALSGVLAADAGNVTGVVKVFDSQGREVTLSKSTPAGVYAERVTSLTGSAASKYVLSGSGDQVGTLAIGN
jgi:hypothetical protein